MSDSAVALNAAALAALGAAHVDAMEWARYHRMGEAWRGAACGCPSAECPGWHHDVPDECPCLPALLQTKRLEDAVTAAQARSQGCPRGCPDGECYCAEPTYREMNAVCPGGCGGHDDDCYCDESPL